MLMRCSELYGDIERVAEKITPPCMIIKHGHKSNRLDSYGAMCHTRMIPVLNNMTGFTRKYQYPNIDRTLESEWGGINNIRYFVSSQGSISSNASLLGNDIANCFVTAKEGYKVVWQSGGKAKFIYLPPGLSEALAKSRLIDLEGYVMQEAA